MSGLKNIGNSILGYFGMSLDNFKLEKGSGGGYNVSFKQWNMFDYFKYTYLLKWFFILLFYKFKHLW